MAVVVLGAGATRGASFVDGNRACLPPLDSDFYTQLQRIANGKHQKLIDEVISDAVEMFGTNFSVTMETMFTTLEHTSRMLETTGENKDFTVEDIWRKQNRLKQAIAAVLEESISPSVTTPNDCRYHERLVRGLRKSDAIISFNYDCVIDHSLKLHGATKWNPHHGYGFILKGAGGKNLTGDQFWMPPGSGVVAADSIKLLKLHGSLNFLVTNEMETRPTVHLKERPYTKQHGELRFTIIPPESSKRYEQGVFGRMWKSAADEIHRTRTIVFIGYSLPTTDMHSTALFRISVKKQALDPWWWSILTSRPDREF